MRPGELRELFDYLIDTRSRFLAKFREVGWEEVARDRGATWGSMLGIFLHLLDDEEGWLQYAARGRSMAEAPVRQPGRYSSFDQLSRDDAEVGRQTRAFLEEVTEEDLGREVAFPDASGETRRTMQKVVTHAFVDELAHVGELVCLLWQLDVKPPYLDWIDYHVSRAEPSGPA